MRQRPVHLFLYRVGRLRNGILALVPTYALRFDRLTVRSRLPVSALVATWIAEHPAGRYAVGVPGNVHGWPVVLLDARKYIRSNS